MTDWMKIGTDVVVGGAAGAVDQLIQNADDKRVAAKPDLGVMSRYGTYYNYGVPLLAVIGVAMGKIRGEMATRLVSVGSTLAGRRVIKQVVKSPSPWTRYNRKGSPSSGGGVPATVGIEF